MLVQCYTCDADKEIPDKEFRRQIKNGRTRFFCSRSCACKYGNDVHNRINPIIEKTCPACGSIFQTKSGAKEKTFCCRSCASKGSVNETRREAARVAGFSNIANLITMQQILKKREAWKYVNIEELLKQQNADYEFEFCFEERSNYIYDLAVKNLKTIIEFDSSYHNYNKQQDEQKDQYAETQGWKLIRIATDSACVIPTDSLEGIFPLNPHS